MENFCEIEDLFNEIAPKYDFMNDIISFGLHRIIKKIALKNIKLPNNAVIADLCCGTGDVSKLLSKKREVKQILGVDFSDNMLEIAKRKNMHSKINYLKADCTNLPFEDNLFDAITMFFGFRNIRDKDKALTEIKRVLKPNGQFIHLDFSKMNKFTDFIFDTITPFWANIFLNNSKPYKYLVKSKQNFYTPKELINILKRNNFELTEEKSLLFSTISFLVFKNN